MAEMDTEKTFDKLPVEVISHIFLFLHFKDRKTSSSVCRSWYEASIHPIFLTKETICFRDMDDNQIQFALKVYTKSLRAFFSFKIVGLGICKSHGDNDDNDVKIVVDKYHWANTVWPLLATKVFYLEFAYTVEFVEDILPTMLNATQQLKVLKIHNLQYSPYEELYKVKKLHSLKELTLDSFLPENIDKNKLLGIIPEHLHKICLKFIFCSKPVGDIVNVLRYCSSYLETLELVNIDVTPELLRSIACLGLKLKEFCLILLNSMFCDHKSEILWPLFKTQWPLISLTLHADFLTNEHLYKIVHTFKNLEVLSICNDETALNINEQVINSISTLKNFILYTRANTILLKKIK